MYLTPTQHSTELFTQLTDLIYPRNTACQSEKISNDLKTNMCGKALPICNKSLKYYNNIVNLDRQGVRYLLFPPKL